MYLAVVDTSQIQSYIFGSNKLCENLGASFLVSQATGKWAAEALEKVARGNSKIVYSGGGNFMAEIGDELAAKAFERELSKRVLQCAPGLQITIVSRSAEQSSDSKQTLDEIFKELARIKAGGPRSVPPLGLGVTAACTSTGLPATAYVGDPGESGSRRASAEVLAKLSAVNGADAYLRDQLKLNKEYDYPGDFDLLGRDRDEHSYIAVVHADGNGMGKRFQALDNLDEISAFSKAVSKASMNALRECVGMVVGSVNNGLIEHKNSVGELVSRLTLRVDGKDGSDDKIRWLLPFRPIVFAGDDVTFVCDGRLGLSLAIGYLEAFEKHTKNLPDGQGAATACAGIAIVKTHYPFARAYELAEELCKSAKIYRAQNDIKGACLDWHYATSGLSGSIEEIRKREYLAKQKPGKVNRNPSNQFPLTLRPVSLNDNCVNTERSWQVIRRGIDAFQEEEWANRHNKMKALRDVLREGASAVEKFITRYQLGRLPDVGLDKDSRRTGWINNRCCYFDAIEMSDWFIPLKEADES